MGVGGHRGLIESAQRHIPDEIDEVTDDENVNSFLTEADDSDDDAGIENFESETFAPLESDDDGSDDEITSW